MTNEPWRKAIDDLDTEVLGAQTIAFGGAWTGVFTACALLDAGLIDRPRLLEMIDALISIVTTLTADDLGEPGDATYALETLRVFLETADVPPGKAVEGLRLWDETEMRKHLARLSKRLPPRL